MASKRVGWRREPARHSLASKGIGTKAVMIKKRLNKYEHRASRHTAQSHKWLKGDWEGLKPQLVEALKYIRDARKIMETAGEPDVDKLDELETQVFDFCVGYAMDALGFDDDNLLKDIGSTWNKYGPVSADDPIEEAIHLISDR